MNEGEIFLCHQSFGDVDLTPRLESEHPIPGRVNESHFSCLSVHMQLRGYVRCASGASGRMYHGILMLMDSAECHARKIGSFRLANRGCLS
jgi:hypothetical protein